MTGKSMDRNEAEVVPRGGLSDLAYDRILECLFDRRVSAGAFVSQGELSELVGVPVAPLRDALRVLEAEGILTIHPRSGIQFVRPGLELTRSTYQFRSILERAAIRVFAEQGDDAEIEILHGRHAALIASIEGNGLTPQGLAEVDEMEHLLHGAVIAHPAQPVDRDELPPHAQLSAAAQARPQVHRAGGAADAARASGDPRRPARRATPTGRKRRSTRISRRRCSAISG